jgi:1-deoxy-D-xylulose-5-phosphate synthase
MALLDEVRRPEDVASLSTTQLALLAEEIRQFLVDKVCRTGGHLGPNLGTVELTLALHRVFSSPRDTLLWDTGHQTYVHKVLTGRRHGFDTLRQKDGLSGYPSRAESEHDVIENSHASTVLSYADGLARGLLLSGKADRTVVAVVGDGALTGGMAWEALNNIAAAKDLPLVIVVNDNGRSYAPTVGGLAGHLPAVLVAGLGLEYLGPVDGHDVLAVEHALRHARSLGGPVVVHCLTVKGRGHPPAENHEADRLHAVSAGNGAGNGSAPSWTGVFGAELLRQAGVRDDLVAITAAMLEPTGLGPTAARFPERVFDVGIAEQHAVTFAAGLALAGMHPVVAVYSTFLNRAFDQVLMDVALHRLPVTFVLDRAGVTGDDGPSHNGMLDLSVFQTVPGLRIAAPRDAPALRELLGEALDVTDGPTMLRFPKGAVAADHPAITRVSDVDVLCRAAPADLLLVSVGALAPICLEVADRLAVRGFRCTVVDPRWTKPISPALLTMAAEHRLVVTVEDNLRAGGFGTALAQALRDARIGTPLVDFGLPQRFLAHGKRAEVLAECGLTAEEIANQVISRLACDGGLPEPPRQRVAEPI